MRVSFLTGFFPSYRYNEIISHSRGVIQYAADALQNSILQGLIGVYPDITVINLPYLGGYPQLYNKPIYSGSKGSHLLSNGQSHIINDIGFCNIKGIKHLSRYYQVRHALHRWCEQNNGEQKVVLIYAVTSPFIKACADMKKKFQDLKIVLIVPDLPEYMGGTNSGYMKYIRQVNQKILNKGYQVVDGYVLLSEYMREKLPVNDKPWSVMEGIYNPLEEVENDIGDVNYGKFILYTGTLAKRYGILNLVNAFCETHNTEFKLLICGAGDAETEINKSAKRDKRIVYLGQLPRKNILTLQKNATILVNPRTPEGEFTKYSFPSKTMEYFGSGTPCLIYKLPGIPTEYYEYCYALEDVSNESLSRKLEMLMEKPEEELKAMGSSAKDFITKFKNPSSQVIKIKEIIDQL